MSGALLAAVDGLLAAVFLALGWLTLEHRDRHGARTLGVLLVVLSLLSLSIAGSRLDLLPFEDVIAWLLAYWVVVVPLWAMFTFEYTGRGPLVTRRLAVSVFGLGAVVWVFTVGFSRGEDVLGGLISISTGLSQVLLLSLGFFGLFLLGRSAVTYGDLSVPLAVVLSLAGFCVSFLILPVSVLGLSPPVSTVPPLMTWYLVAIAALFVVILGRFRPFEDVPGAGHVGRKTVFDAMREAVLVVDRRNRLVDANTAAQRTFGFDQDDAVGRPLVTVVGSDLDGVADSGSADDRVNLSTPRGRREFDASGSRLENRQGDRVGRAYLLQDVTEQRTQQQRLEVLNRVLRHNLRNDLDAIRAFSETLREDSLGDQEAADLAERIETTARDLADIGATVERSEQVLTRGTLEREPVEFPTLLEEVATAVEADYPACDVAVAVTTTPESFRTDRAVLRTALLEVVENAVEHNDGDTPTVSVTVEETDTGVAITVRDNGPGIPTRERDVLLEGEETPLRHGTGVGLWLVYWGITRLGGSLSFSEADPRGSVVTLRVPDRGRGA